MVALGKLHLHATLLQVLSVTWVIVSLYHDTLSLCITWVIVSLIQ